jgi:PAS domain S-box-containing protein
MFKSFLEKIFSMITKIFDRKKSGFMYEDVVENSPLCIKVFDKNGTLLFINSGGRKEHTIKPNIDITKWDWLLTVDPKYRNYVKKSFDDTFSGTKESQIIEFQHTPEGSDHEWCWGVLSPIKDKDGSVKNVLFYSIDVSRRRYAEIGLSESENRSRLILESSTEGILGLNTEGKHTFVNQAAANMFGWNVEELIGKPSHVMWHHTKADGTPFPKEECPIYGAYREGKVHKGTDGLFWRKDGTSFSATYASTPIWENDKIVGAVVIFSDITEQKKNEEAMKEHTKELESMNKTMIGRELKMVELKETIKKLEGELKKYKKEES